jgi:hypothetical protein
VRFRDDPLPRRPFRSSAIVYGALAGFVFAFGTLTGNGLIETIAIAIAFFVLATGYTWWRFHQRMQRGERPR